MVTTNSQRDKHSQRGLTVSHVSNEPTNDGWKRNPQCVLLFSDNLYILTRFPRKGFGFTLFIRQIFKNYYGSRKTIVISFSSSFVFSRHREEFLESSNWDLSTSCSFSELHSLYTVKILTNYKYFTELYHYKPREMKKAKVNAG